VDFAYRRARGPNHRVPRSSIKSIHRLGTRWAFCGLALSADVRGNRAGGGRAAGLPVLIQADSESGCCSSGCTPKARAPSGRIAPISVAAWSIGKPLRQLILGDIQAYKDSLLELAAASQARKLLLSFGHETRLPGL
jgi:hypothetical protein